MYSSLGKASTGAGSIAGYPRGVPGPAGTRPGLSSTRVPGSLTSGASRGYEVPRGDDPNNRPARSPTTRDPPGRDPPQRTTPVRSVSPPANAAVADASTRGTAGRYNPPGADRTPPKVGASIPGTAPSTRQRGAADDLLSRQRDRAAAALNRDSDHASLLGGRATDFGASGRTGDPDVMREENGRLREELERWASQVKQLKEQVREKEEDSAKLEEMLKAEIARLNQRCEQMLQQQTVLDDEAAEMEDQLRKELAKAREDCGLGAAKDGHVRILEQQLEQSLAKQKDQVDKLTKTYQEKQVLEEDLKKVQFQLDREAQTLKEERVRWRQQEQIFEAERAEHERKERVMRQQFADLQEKFDKVQKEAAAAEEEKIALRARNQRLEDIRRTHVEEQDSTSKNIIQDMELELSALKVDNAQMKVANERLKQEKLEESARCAQLQVSIEQLEERQRYLPNNVQDGSVRSLSSRGSSRFRTTLKGQNCSMTADGTTATRTKGCRQCVVMGDSPLELFPGVGWYFELMINDVVTGWVGGLGIGITMSKASRITALPDRAWRIPDSWIAGYWGRMFTDGQQHFVDWKPQDLRTRDKVGFLVTMEGECKVYVNGDLKVKFNEVLVPVKTGSDEPTALVDIFASTASVTLLEGAQPPEMRLDSSQADLGMSQLSVNPEVGNTDKPVTPRVPLLFLPQK